VTVQPHEDFHCPHCAVDLGSLTPESLQSMIDMKR
jgi:hypothetical protein